MAAGGMRLSVVTSLMASAPLPSLLASDPTLSATTCMAVAAASAAEGSIPHSSPPGAGLPAGSARAPAGFGSSAVATMEPGSGRKAGQALTTVAHHLRFIFINPPPLLGCEEFQVLTAHGPGHLHRQSQGAPHVLQRLKGVSPLGCKRAVHVRPLLKQDPLLPHEGLYSRHHHAGTCAGSWLGVGPSERAHVMHPGAEEGEQEQRGGPRWRRLVHASRDGLVSPPVDASAPSS